MLSGSRWNATTWLVGATAGVYLLVVVGATASLADAAEACSSWPVCSEATEDPVVLVALAHHVLAAVVGLTLLGAAITALRTDTPRRVLGAVALAVALYPLQIAVGAYLAITGPVLPGLHLLVGLLIFGTLVAALAWQLEHETGDPDESPDPDLTAPSEDPSDAPTTQDTPETPLADRPLGARLRAKGFAYFRLMKPRLMWLLSLVAAAAMALAAMTGFPLTVETIVLTLGGGVLAIGASGTFNNVLERDRDRKMSRTSDRPLVRHVVPTRNAIGFGVALTALSLVFFLQLNPLTAALGLTAVLFYSVIYTLVLKPNTVQNTVIGGAAGSLPALIGWAAVTGRIDVAGLMLATLIFVWTPSHFYNLALAYQDDYERGGFPMMPVVRGETETRKHVLWWLGATLAATTALIWLTPLAWVTAGISTAVGAVFLWAVVRLHREQTDQAAFRAFHASNAYLGLVLIAIVVESLAF
jgi:protoheme IX farnesyltransferase